MSVNEKPSYLVIDAQGNVIGVFTTGNKPWELMRSETGEEPMPRLRPFVEELRAKGEATMRVGRTAWKASEIRINTRVEGVKPPTARLVFSV